MSSSGAKPLKALAEVLADDVRTPRLAGKEAVLHWFKTSPLMPMFRSGAWEEPVIDGSVVTFVNRFNPKAAYYGATVEVTVGPSGLITRAQTAISSAPEPLGAVITRVWGERSGSDTLGDHLASTYGVTVKKVSPLQEGNHGVHRVDLATGGPWVVWSSPPTGLSQT